MIRIMPIIIAIFGFFAVAFTFLVAIFMRLLPWVLVIGALWFAAEYFELKDAVDDWRSSLPATEVRK